MWPTSGRRQGNTDILMEAHLFPPYPEALFPDPVDGRSLKISEADLQLQTHRQLIEDRLQAGWQPVTILEELPVSTGRSSFYRFLHRHKLIDIGENARKALVEEIIYAPAEALNS